VLSGTFEFFALGDVLSLIERAEASGALVVHGREVEGALYFVRGQLSAGEIGEVSGPVEGRHALEVRLLEVMVPLLRARTAKFEFRVDAAPSWPTTVDVPITGVFEHARGIARDWSSIMKAIGNFETALGRSGEITSDTITLSHLGFRVLELVDGKRSIREVARRAGVTLVAVAPEVRALLDAGAVVVVDGDAGAATRVDLVVDGVATAEPAEPIRAAVPTDPAEAMAEFERDQESPDPAVVPLPEPPPGAPVTVPAAAASAPPVPAPPAPPVPEPAADAAEPAPPRSDPAPEPEPAPTELAPTLEPVGAAPAPARSEIVVDRSELLRMFSGLKDE
jgi:hypothetical protein